jgi:BRCA1 C Terminus (BRCT) domain
MTRTYEYESLESAPFTLPQRVQKTMSTIYGLLQGMDADGVISKEEKVELVQFFKQYSSIFSMKLFRDVEELVWDIVEDNIITTEEWEGLDHFLCQTLEGCWYYNDATLSLQQLNGIVTGIASDRKIEANEVTLLAEWLSSHDELKGYWPYDEVDAMITEVLSDGIITEEEKRPLLAFFDSFTATFNNKDPKPYHSENSPLSIQGICCVDPTIIFPGKSFCITGKFNVTRKKVVEIITKQGGLFHNTIVKNLDYLIVGNEGNTCWAYSCYGRKVEKAMTYRREGMPIIIVNELDFWDALVE